MVRVAKGKRPVYLGDRQTDQLLAIVVALMGEVSVLRDRLDTLERLIEAKGLVLQQDIETYEPDELVAQTRLQWREDYIARVLRILQEEGKGEEQGVKNEELRTEK